MIIYSNVRNVMLKSPECLDDFVFALNLHFLISCFYIDHMQMVLFFSSIFMNILPSTEMKGNLIMTFHSVTSIFL